MPTFKTLFGNLSGNWENIKFSWLKVKNMKSLNSVALWFLNLTNKYSERPNCKIVFWQMATAMYLLRGIINKRLEVYKYYFGFLILCVVLEVFSSVCCLFEECEWKIDSDYVLNILKIIQANFKFIKWFIFLKSNKNVVINFFQLKLEYNAFILFFVALDKFFKL